MIVYTAQSAGTGFSLFIWDVAGWTSTEIGPLASGVNSVQPTWSPSGLSIAFSSNLDGFYHIWMLNISGNLASSSTGY
jgi:Tol biopolymer transport system component